MTTLSDLIERVPTGWNWLLRSNSGAMLLTGGKDGDCYCHLWQGDIPGSFGDVESYAPTAAAALEACLAKCA